MKLINSKKTYLEHYMKDDSLYRFYFITLNFYFKESLIKISYVHSQECLFYYTGITPSKICMDTELKKTEAG